MADDGYEDGLIGPELQPPSRIRDQGGKFIRTERNPEPLFKVRMVEGTAAGDTSDAGDDSRLRSIERNIADGRPEQEAAGEEGASREPVKAASEGNRHATADDGSDLYEEEYEDPARESGDGAEGGESGQGERKPDEEGPKYEVTIDGEPHEVSLQEALNGYVREKTFHQRMSQLDQIQHNMEADADRLQKGWQLWHKARQDYEEDLFSLIPKEPDWDREFAVNPQAAHANQKIYHALYAKLAASRQSRLERETKDAEEAAQRLANYAKDSYNKFRAVHAKRFANPKQYEKDIQSMKRTAFEAGFTQDEIDRVFDYRMNTVLLWASIERRIRASRPVAVVPGKGRTLTPGAATPLAGNAGRKGLDEALKRQQQSGRLDETAAVFEHLLR